MGGAFPTSKYRLMNAAHRTERGWLSSSDIQDVPRTGIYSVQPVHETPESNAYPTALKMKSNFIGTTTKYYYISYSTEPPFAGETLVHIANEPLTGGFFTILHASLADGEIYTDYENVAEAAVSYEIKQVSHDENGAQVKITFY